MERAEWIWKRGGALPDEYVQFYTDFEYTGGRCVLRLCADSAFAVWLNGQPVGFGKYPDFPHYRVEDEIDLTDFAKSGKNRLAILAYYIGVDFSTYYTGSAGLIFEVTGENGVLAYSGTHVACRLAPDYCSHRERKITTQMGYSYRYDATKSDGWTEIGAKVSGFEDAVLLDLPKKFVPRPISRLKTKSPIVGRVVQQGTFTEPNLPMAGERMLRAALAFETPENAFGVSRAFYTLNEPLTVRIAGGEGVYVIVDLGREESGLLHLDFQTDLECEVEIGYGEHLQDGRVRTSIGGRDFAFEYRAAAGKNVFTDFFRRLGGRYLQIFFRTNKVTLNAATVVPVYYPLTRREQKIENRLYREIYDVSVRTLELCMHDHYEDTPWREQSFYAMDSRNQILFGYTAFEDSFPFVRASLRLFAEARRQDGLLSLCAPQGKNSDYPIPYFSLMYVIEVAEYCEHTGDYTLADEVFSVLRGIMDTMENRIAENGLLKNFADPAVWDFYEWTPGMAGIGHTEDFEAPLNGFYLIAADKFVRLCRASGRNDGGTEDKAERVRAACEAFFVPEKGLYKSFMLKEEHFSELTSSLLILAGAAKGKRADDILDRLAQSENGMVTISVSHSIFKYEALFTRGERYADCILREVEERFLKMLREGATSFWETDLGSEDFDRAGSLCHGWSSVPIYVFEKLGICKRA